MATNEEKKQALDLFNSFDGGRFKEFVLEAGNDKNSEKGAGMVHWLSFVFSVADNAEPYQ